MMNDEVVASGRGGQSVDATTTGHFHAADILLRRLNGGFW